MHPVLRHLDMNLLLVFDALYRQRSVSDAASELALSPSAVSHALIRLRTALNDPLFVRAGKRMAPTARAESLAGGIAIALSHLSSCLSAQDDIDIATSRQVFTFSATDYTAAVVLPTLIARVNRAAPGIVIKLRYTQEFAAADDLVSGNVDFALGYEEEPAMLRREISAISCFTDEYAVAVRREHPDIDDTLSLAQYLRAGHVVVRPWHGLRGAIDSWLESQQLQRHIVVELPSLMIAPFIVSSTDLIMTLPKKGINSLFTMQDLKVFATPFPSPQYTLKAWFNPTLGNSPGHRWMREQLQAIGDAHAG